MGTRANLGEIKLLVLDVDGVLTDGTVATGEEGGDVKFFNSLDGHGIRLWRRAGFEVAFLSGRGSEAVKHRAAELGVEHVFLDCHEKLPVVRGLLAELGLSSGEAGFIGDDLPDLPAMRHVGFGAAVANAVDEVREQADYVTSRGGGRGAVREVIEYILKNTGRWEGVIKRYMD
jgi:3-deoxy-D-manno-octulosonate 8-phosphate phosphatase (KDO 8-P phosphatase)